MKPSTKLPDNAGRGCWRTVGVWGRERPRCPLLEEVTHCRHCDIYVNAGRQLFDRLVFEDYRQSHADTVARQAEVLATSRVSALIFRLEGQLLALPADVIQRVVEPAPVHRLPHQGDPTIRGLVSFLGRVRLCVDLGHLLSLSTDSQGAQGRRLMVAMAREGRWFVFEANAVIGIESYAPETLGATPAHLVHSAFSTGIIPLDAGPVVLLDADVLFDHLMRRAAS